MLRTLVCAAFALVLCAVAVLAGEYRGKVKSVDPDKNTIIVTDKDGTDKTFKVSDGTKIVRGKGDKEKDVKNGLKNEKAWSRNPNVIVTTEGDSPKGKVG
jgi:hypothetical protein